VIPAGQSSVDVDVIYKPLTMTKEDEQKGETTITDVHKGSLFIATPDGNAYMYQLEGKALPPTIDQKIDVEVACKTNHTQAIPVTNWLSQRQRFNVKLSLKDPAPDSDDAS
jgi:hydrocephalus-inducing protein